jgi:protein O-GlcNAc transferase
VSGLRRSAVLGLVFLLNLALLGQSADDFVHRAQHDIQAGRYAQAEQELSKALQTGPGKWNLWYDLGLLRLQLEENDSAIFAFEHARQLDPRVAPPYFGLGLAYTKKSVSEKAIEAYREGLIRDPSDTAANQNYAFLLTELGRSRDAIEPLRRLKAQQPNDVPARASLINSYFKAGMKSEATDEINQLMEAHIATPQECLSLAKLLVQEHEPTAAAQVLERAATVWPDSAQLHGNLGLLLIQGSLFEAAAAELGRASQIDADSAPFALGLGEALLRWRHDPIAEQYLLKIRDKFGDLPLFKFELGMAYFNLTEFPSALRELETLVQQQPQSGQVHFLLAATYQELGQLDKAEKSYREAIALKHDEPTYYMGLASLLKKIRPEDVDESLQLTQKALSLSPENEEAKLLLASCYQSQDKLPEAQALLEAVAARDPDSRPTHVALAQVYFREKKIQQATEEQEIAAKLEDRKQSAVSPWGPGMGNNTSSPLP